MRVYHRWSAWRPESNLDVIVAGQYPGVEYKSFGALSFRPVSRRIPFAEIFHGSARASLEQQASAPARVLRDECRR